MALPGQRHRPTWPWCSHRLRIAVQRHAPHDLRAIQQLGTSICRRPCTHAANASRRLSSYAIPVLTSLPMLRSRPSSFALIRQRASWLRLAPRTNCRVASAWMPRSRSFSAKNLRKRLACVDGGPDVQVMTCHALALHIVHSNLELAGLDASPSMARWRDAGRVGFVMGPVCARPFACQKNSR